MRFTVLTATYNRATYLPGVYESLCAQTFRDFEWVIVDDGSTDGTRELVASWKSFFPIRYAWKPNGGKHTAINRGAQMASGDFIFIVDSDDRCLPQSLERFDYHWRQIPNPDRFAFVVALDYREDGKTILGKEFPRQVMDIFRLREALVLADSDRCSIIRTDVFKKFPYPVFKNERDMLEGVAWNRILREYGARYVNEPLKIGGYAPGGITGQRDRRTPNPKGAVVYYTDLVFSDVPLRLKLKSAANAIRFSLLAAFRAIAPKRTP